MIEYKDFTALNEPGVVVMDYTTKALNKWVESSKVRIVNIETLCSTSPAKNERGLRVWYEKIR